MFRTCRLARSPASDVNWYLNNDGAFSFSLFLIIFLHKTNESIGKKASRRGEGCSEKKILQSSIDSRKKTMDAKHFTQML